MLKNLVPNLLDKIIYLGIFALFIVPFLIPYSYFPVSKFYSEIIAVILSSLIGIFAIYRVERIEISSTGLATLIFGIFLILQIFLVHIRYPGVNLYVALEFFVATLLSIGITSLVGGSEEKQKELVIIVAWAVLMSVTIQAIYGFLQYTGQAANLSNFILYSTNKGSNIIGNVGQKNDYADFISVGVFALSYLFFIRQINLIVYSLYALFFAGIITINTSRTTFTYFVFALLMALIFMWFNRKNSENKKTSKTIFMILAGLIIGLFVVEAILPKLLDSLTGQTATSGIYRFSSSDVGQSTYRRFYEWYKDIIIFIHYPIFGIGWYQYPKEAIDLMMTPRFMYIPANSALYTHSHNSPLNILAETGIVGFLITMGYGVIYSLYKMFRNFNNTTTLFLSFMLLTIFAQSLFQYPLWYAYFLMFFVLFLSINKATFSFKNNGAIKIIISIAGLGFLWFCWTNMAIYNQLVSDSIVPQDSDDYANNVQQIRSIIDNNILWSFPASMVLDAYNLPGAPLTNSALSLQDQEKYIDMLGNEMPYPGAIFKQLIIHRLVGDTQGSLHYADVLAHGYPFFKDKFAAQLQNDPRFNAEVSVIYNFEYQDKSIFVHLFSKKDDK